MSSFLARLAARQLAPGGELRPRAMSRFAAPGPEAAPEAPPLLVRPVPAARQSSDAASPAAAVAEQAASASLPGRGRPDATDPPAPRPVPRAAEHASRGDDPPRLVPAGERDAGDTPHPRSGGIEPIARVAPAVARAPEHPPQPVPLVPREIVRAREATAQHAPAPARVTTAPAPGPVEVADEPVVRITIGRIEVRAATPAAAPRREPRAAPRPTTMSLDEYLDRRHGPRR
jgi:hypothetical protein